MKHKAAAIFALVMVLVLTASCAAPPQHSGEDQPSSDPQVSTSPSETTENPSAPSKEPLSVEEYNYQSVHSEDGRHITGSFVIDDTYTLKIDAVVDVSNAERVGMYEYVPASITDAQREALLGAYFGDRIDEVKHNTKGWANQWYIETDHEYYEFGYSFGMNLISEETFFLRDFKKEIREADTRMLGSIGAAGMRISMDEAYEMCERLLSTVTDDLYTPTNVRPFKMNPNTDDGMLWIVWSKTIDGIPITADNDPKFYVTDNSVIYLHSTVYDIEPVVLDSKIISLNGAIAHLQENALDINYRSNFMSFENIYSDMIPITEITFEYIVVRDENYRYTVVPAWRFLIGDDEESRLMYKDRIVAINAITGELIAERRRHNL